MVRLSIKDPNVPPGTYIGKFTGTESTEHPEFNEGLRWAFQIVEGPFTGWDVFRTTKPTPKKRTNCGKFLASLAGTTPAMGLDVQTDDYIGHRYVLIVDFGQDGESTRVESFFPETDD